MGRKERREREQRRENYASKRSSEMRTQKLIAVGVLAVVASIVGYSGYLFVNLDTNSEFGPLGSAHNHAAILVKIFGDEFDFSGPAYQVKSPFIHFENGDGTTIHQHATGVPLERLFDTISVGLDDECYKFPDNRREFCTNEDYSLKFYINGEQKDSILDHVIGEDDRILISYGDESQEDIDKQLQQLENQRLVK